MPTPSRSSRGGRHVAPSTEHTPTTPPRPIEQIETVAPRAAETTPPRPVETTAPRAAERADTAPRRRAEHPETDRRRPAGRAPAPRRRPGGRVAKTAVTVVLMVSVGSFAMALPSDVTQSPLMADVAGVRAERAATAAAAEQVSTRHRQAVVAAAAAAAEQAQSVRTVSSTVVPAETLTELAQATAELDQLLAAAGAPVELAATPTPAPLVRTTRKTTRAWPPSSNDRTSVLSPSAHSK